jgi:hypothetical protein
MSWSTIRVSGAGVLSAVFGVFFLLLKAAHPFPDIWSGFPSTGSGFPIRSVGIFSPSPIEPFLSCNVYSVSRLTDSSYPFRNFQSLLIIRRQ